MGQPTACPRCGQRPRSGAARFCIRCGMDLSGAMAQPIAPPKAPPPAAPPPMAPPIVVPSMDQIFGPRPLVQQVVHQIVAIPPPRLVPLPKPKSSGCGCMFMLLLVAVGIVLYALPASFWKAQISDVSLNNVPSRPRMVLPSTDTTRLESATATLFSVGSNRSLTVQAKLRPGRTSPVIVAVYPLDARDEWYGPAVAPAAAKRVTFSWLSTQARRDESVNVTLVVPSSALPYVAPGKVDVIVFSESGQALKRSTITVNGW